MSEPTTTDAPAPTGESATDQAKTFTQADVDRIVSERVQRAKAAYADYDDLKAKAGELDTANGRVTELEREVLRRTVQARHGISDEDADLFLTGGDEAALTAQATRLAARSPENAPTNYVPAEGDNPRPPADPTRKFASELFGAGSGEPTT